MSKHALGNENCEAAFAAGMRAVDPVQIPEQRSKSAELRSALAEEDVSAPSSPAYCVADNVSEEYIDQRLGSYLPSLALVEEAAEGLARRDGIALTEALDRLSGDFNFTNWADLRKAFASGQRILMPQVIDENDHPMEWIDLYREDGEILRSLNYVKMAAKSVKRRDDLKHVESLRVVCATLGFRTFRELSNAFDAGVQINLPDFVDQSGARLKWIEQFR